MFDFSDYQKTCEVIAESDLFYCFRSDQTFHDMYEHVTFEEGLKYIEQIKKTEPAILSLLESFLTNDRIGAPTIYYYEEFDFRISPTTLRYVKVLVDLVHEFGSLDGMDIVEVGGGYGGQCKIIHDMFKPKSYTLIDLPEAIKLAERYLKEFGIRPQGQFERYDLFISNYAFTEIPRAYQDLYKEKFIDKSDRGYITCNFYQVPGDMMTFNEILKMKDNFKVLEEIPQTAKDNFLYLWGAR